MLNTHAGKENTLTEIQNKILKSKFPQTFRFRFQFVFLEPVEPRGA